MYETRRDTEAQLRRFLDVLARHRAQLEARLAELRTTLDEVVAQEAAARAGRCAAAGRRRERRRPLSRPRSPTRARSRSRARCSTASTATTGSFARRAPRRRRASRRPTGTASSSAQAQRIEYYERRVAEATERLQSEFEAATLPMEVWQQVKLHYIGLLIDHYQPECAETFFNSVTTKILHRSYFHNDFIFVRSAVSTEHLENDEPAALPTYRAYYPTQATRWSRPGTASSPTSSSSASSRTSAATSPT